MPPRRRGGAAAATRSNQQATLSFGPNSRVTKPSAAPSPSDKAKHLEPISNIAIPEISTLEQTEPQQIPVTPAEPTQPHVAELAVRQQAKAEVQEPWTEDDEKALKLTPTELLRYWKQEEKSRKAPRVHQGELSVQEKILRHFDLSSQYGPCIGIARLKRWRRANMLGLNPPIEVLAVLLQEKDDVKQRAYVDELMS